MIDWFKNTFGTALNVGISDEQRRRYNEVINRPENQNMGFWDTVTNSAQQIYGLSTFNYDEMRRNYQATGNPNTPPPDEPAKSSMGLIIIVIALLLLLRR